MRRSVSVEKRPLRNRTGSNGPRPSTGSASRSWAMRFGVYQARIEGRTTVDGHPVLIAHLTPRKDAEVATREGRWMKQFEGQLWIAEADDQMVKVDMRAVSDVTIGWGVVGRIYKGTRVLYVRRRFENAWLPAETTYEASGRTLIFRPFQFNVSTTYSGYKRRDKSMND